MPSPADSAPWSLEWTEELSFGIPEIDAEHQHFIQLVNELNDCIASRMSISEVNRCMQAVLDDAVAHFAHEETLLTEWGYPDAAEHAKRDAQLISALREIMKNLTARRTEYEWVEAALQIKKILIDNLLNEDMKYRDYCLRRLSSSER